MDRATQRLEVREAVQERAEIVLSRLHSFTRVGPDQFDELVRGQDSRVRPSQALQRASSRSHSQPAEQQQVLVSERLAPMRHRVAAFMCTDDELNAWLRYKAAEQQHIERCFVCCSQGHDEVDAFYALTGHRLVREATDAIEGQLPALIVSRLAVAWGQQHTGMGALLLADALRRVASASEVDGARFVVVQARNEHALGFYEHHGFRRIPGTDRLVQRIADVTAALDA